MRNPADGLIEYRFIDSFLTAYSLNQLVAAQMVNHLLSSVQRWGDAVRDILKYLNIDTSETAHYQMAELIFSFGTDKELGA